VEVIETMLGKGFDIRIYDQHVSLARLMGANKEYIQKEIPHISKLMCGDLREVVEQSKVIVISHRDEAFKQALDHLQSGQVIIDLVRIADANHVNGPEYFGICW
jgi:GDP-mannose 6-dehydrogenase